MKAGVPGGYGIDVSVRMMTVCGPWQGWEAALGGLGRAFLQRALATKPSEALAVILRQVLGSRGQGLFCLGWDLLAPSLPGIYACPSAA